MNAAVFDIFENIDLTPAVASASGDGKSWRRAIWKDEADDGTIVAVWKAEPGLYPYPARPLEETFVVLEGEALCTLGDAQPVTIKAGSIVHIPLGTSITLEILSPFRKLATVVPRSA